MAQTRMFAAAASTGGTTLILDPTTGAAHQCPQPVTTGRAAMDHQQVTAWAEDKQTPMLAISGASQLFIDQHRVQQYLTRAGIVAVNLLADRLDNDLVRLAQRLNREDGLLVTVTTNQPGLPRLADALARTVHALRVRLHAPTESEHDRLTLPHQGTYQQSLSGIRAAVDAGVPVQLLVEAPPPSPRDAARAAFAVAAAHRALQLQVSGLTLLPRPGSAARPVSRVGWREPAGRTWLLRQVRTADLPVPTRVGIGRAERAMPSLDAVAAFIADELRYHAWSVPLAGRHDRVLTRRLRGWQRTVA
ncbi:hypothetical protein GCM10010430_44140 [Kitasatospora cystarginea]|uniref:Uncharacterized protein n=1 Tax=Kitasatospora cystarginea TaxID=58350 RepID=A0ABN3EEW8_9ACTN